MTNMEIIEQTVKSPLTNELYEIGENGLTGTPTICERPKYKVPVVFHI